jgi:hypothetical protein
MGIFSGGENNKPQREFGARVNQSLYGLPYPVVMGTAQVQQSVLWIDGFDATQQSTGKGGSGGGKGGGGKSGSDYYLYTADVVSAICNGPITAIGDVWSGQSWLGSPTASETYTITGSGVYTPANASTMVNDLGVGVQNSYSGSYSDFGAPSPTVMSSSDYQAMMCSPYGAALSSGQYSINPSTGQYNFNTSADSGKTVILSYSFTLTNINQQQNDIVPSGKTISIAIASGQTFGSDLGVRYTTGVSEGVALTKVSSTPSATGTYQVTGSSPVVYHFATGDIGAEVTTTYSISDPAAVGQGQSTTLNFTLNNGNLGQSPFAFLTASYPDAAFGFTGLATILYQPMGLGADAEIQENKFEVITPDVYGGGIQDCNPITCIAKVLTNAQWGLGVGPIPFPTSALDNGSLGTWGAGPTTAGQRLTDSTAWSWFAANSFFISPVIDSQDTAASVASKWLEAGMCAAFMSEGLLKLVPYGDTSTAANGCTWVAPSNFVVALDDTCFVSKEGEDPVKITRVGAHDVWNVVQVQWDNRKNQYSPEITPESDQSLINRWGERREDAQDWNFIHTLQAATFAANMRLKHGSYVRGTYEFTLPYTYSYLEPMDIVTISTTSIWAAGLNNANLGVVNLPIRIIKIVDDPAKGLEITAEDYPFGAHQPVIYNKQIANGDVAANAFSDPGNAEVVMFEATSKMTGYSGDEIWIGANGASDNYGSCNIWVSQDGTTYKQVGAIKAPARMGTLASTFASGSDPDTVNSLVVNLCENCAPLDAGTDTDADYGNTECFCDGEIISYSSCVATGQDQATMSSYIRRGQQNSTISSHAAGSLFLRLDNAIFKYQYDPQWKGQTLYFKFQAVNIFGNNAQLLSSLTPVSFTVPGLNPGTIDAASGLVTATSVEYSGGATVQSLKPAQAGADVTSSHTSADTSAVNSIPAANISASLNIVAWAGRTAYTVGMNVTHSGNTYKCSTANNDASWIIGHWTLLGPSTLDAVVDGTTYQKVLASSLSAGVPYVFKGAYAGGTTYAQGNECSYNGNYYVYINATPASGQTPAPAGTSYWQCAGPTTLDVIVDGSVYGKVNNTALSSGNVDPSASGVLSKGGTPFSITTGFVYISTTSSITFYWDGTHGSSTITIYRGDGTTVSGISGSQAITGLSSNTAYYFYPYWDEPTQTLLWVTGGTGSPAIAHTATSVTLAQSQNLQSHIALSDGGMAASTEASGTGGGSVGGGGGGKCFSGNVRVRTAKGFSSFAELPSVVLIRNQTGLHIADLIVHEEDTRDMLDMGDGELVTPNHVMKCGPGWAPASELFSSKQTHAGRVYNLHIRSDNPDDQHYVLGNGFVAHNFKSN